MIALGRSSRAVALVVTLCGLLAESAAASADPDRAGARAVSYRLGAAPNTFHDTWQLAVAFQSRAPCDRPPWRLELAVGAIHAPDKTRPFLSAGPAWCRPFKARDLYLELGVSPTLIAGSEVDGQDLGGNLHFTSSIMLGTQLGRGRAWSAALRFQHLSNAGINRPNPGLNGLGLAVSYRFTSR